MARAGRTAPALPRSGRNRVPLIAAALSSLVGCSGAGPAADPEREPTATAQAEREPAVGVPARSPILDVRWDLVGYRTDDGGDVSAAFVPPYSFELAGDEGVAMRLSVSLPTCGLLEGGYRLEGDGLTTLDVRDFSGEIECGGPFAGDARTDAFLVDLFAGTRSLSIDLDGDALTLSSGSGAQARFEAHEEGPPTTFEAFPEALRDAAGPDAEACGQVDAGEPSIEANTCLARAFVATTSAWAVLRVPSVESFAYRGVVTRGRIVTRYHFDGGHFGSTAGNPGMNVTQCLEPSLSGHVDGAVDEVIACGDALTLPYAQGEPPLFVASDRAVPLSDLLLDRTWVWDGYRAGAGAQVRTVSPTPAYSLRFLQDGRAFGFESCNAHSAAWTARDSSLEIGGHAVDDEDCETPSALPYAATLLGTIAFSSDGAVSCSPRRTARRCCSPPGRTRAWTSADADLRAAAVLQDGAPWPSPRRP